MSVELMLCGDLMCGRGVDQLFSTSCDPTLHERHVNDARTYVSMAEQEHGSVPTPVSHRYPWGDAAKVIQNRGPDLRLANLETAITTHDRPWSDKAVHYRMHPENVGTLQVPGLDALVLANNHALDWRRPGLRETLKTLQDVDISTVGAGTTKQEAARPARFSHKEMNISIFAWGAVDAGVPEAWAATPERAGVHLLRGYSEHAVDEMIQWISGDQPSKGPVIVSFHWGSNWGWEIPDRHRRTAHRLIDEAGVDLVYGHSSHHERPLEVYNDRLILYGCGDFVNDYEGIGGREKYRGELSVLYFPEVHPETGALEQLSMCVFRMHRFQLSFAGKRDTNWVRDTLNQTGDELKGTLRTSGSHRLTLKW